MMRPKPQEVRAARTVPVDLSHDSTLAAASGSTQVVVKHGVDKSGSLFVMTSQDGAIYRRLVQDVLAQQAAEYRMAHPWITPDPHTEYLNWVDARKLEIGRARERHVLDVIEGRTDTESGRKPSAYDTTTTTETDRRAAKASELRIDPTTIGRWIDAWLEGGSALFLVPHLSRALSRSGAKDVAPEILAFIRHWARSRHLSSKKTLVNEHALVLSELGRHGLVSSAQGTTRPDGTPIPFELTALSYDAFVKQIRHLSRGRTPRTAKTRQQQSKRPVITGARHRGFDFGDRIEVDATLTDIHVWGPDGPVRLWAVFAVCVSTRYCWLRLVKEPPRGIHLGLLLWDMLGGEAFTTTSPSAPGAPITTVPATLEMHAWKDGTPPPGVLPGCIAADHGAEEENGYFIGLCAQLGIQLLWARTMSPPDKAFVESCIDKFAKACELLPGHKGATVENRPDRLDQELLTFEQAQAAFRHWSQWIATQPHSGLPHSLTEGRFHTPMEAVSMSITRGVPLRVLADPTLPLRLLPTLSLTPQDDGVTWDKRRFAGPAYEKIIQASLDSRGRRGKLTFYYDPDSPRRLFWPEPQTFQVHVLHAPGAASGIIGAFAEVRDAQAKQLVGQTWPSNNVWSRRRAQLATTMRSAWEQDGLTADVVDLTQRRAKSSRSRGANAEAKHRREVWDNGGWDLSEFEALIDDDADDWDTAPDDPFGSYGHTPRHRDGDQYEGA